MQIPATGFYYVGSVVLESMISEEVVIRYSHSYNSGYHLWRQYIYL